MPMIIGTSRSSWRRARRPTTIACPLRTAAWRRISTGRRLRRAVRPPGSAHDTTLGDRLPQRCAKSQWTPARGGHEARQIVAPDHVVLLDDTDDDGYLPVQVPALAGGQRAGHSVGGH